ncbi:hypothetical protein SK128_022144 [Halocaridina rubra]|uniref:Uncharacterized protein n=1 Tax=Halocaridina rubra TaxID=373956 RepID=A0AAN9A447_HALRR
MLRGPSWSGSIQQDLIEKLWVAILAYDSSKPVDSLSSHSEIESEAKKESDESEESDDSEDSTSSLSDSDYDIDLGNNEGSVALQNRNDLFSIVREKQCQKFSDNSQKQQEINIKAAVDGQENTNVENRPEILNITPDKEDRTSEILASRPTLDPSFQIDSFSHSGAKPKVNLTPQTQPAVENRRPRPNTLDLKSCLRISRIPQLSPQASSPSSGQTTFLKNTYSSRNVKSQPRKTAVGMSRGKTSKIPIGPTRNVPVFELHDRSELLAVVPRRRIVSDSRILAENKLRKSYSAMQRRKATTPQASRPYPINTPRGDRTRMKRDLGVPKPTEYYKGSFCRRASQMKDAVINTRTRPNSNNVTVNSRTKLTERMENSNRKYLQGNGIKRDISKPKPVPAKTGNYRKSVETKPLEHKMKICGEKNSYHRKELPKNSKVPLSSNPRGGNKLNNDNRKEKKIQCTGGEKVETFINTRNLLTNNSSVCDAAVDKDIEKASKEDYGHKEDFAQISCHDDDMEVSRLEDCLRAAILGVLEALPEGWILAPEHTAELFSSLVSVIDSFPRPEKAHARVLEAIVDAHTRRPCSKGEIAALNNAHLLLYIGLKLCSIRGKSTQPASNKNISETDNKTSVNLCKEKVKRLGNSNSDEKNKTSVNLHKEKVKRIGNSTSDEEINKTSVNLCKEKVKKIGNSTSDGEKNKTSVNLCKGKVKRIGNSTSDEEQNRELKNEAESQRKKNNSSGNTQPDKLCGHVSPSRMFKKIVDDLKLKRGKDKNETALKILTEIQKCEGSFDRLMVRLI